MQIRTLSLYSRTSNMNFELSKYPLQKSFQKEKEYQKKSFFENFQKNNVLTLRDISPVIFKHFCHYSDHAYFILLQKSEKTCYQKK